jgi:hypothetical protein
MASAQRSQPPQDLIAHGRLGALLAAVVSGQRVPFVVWLPALCSKPELTW